MKSVLLRSAGRGSSVDFAMVQMSGFKNAFVRILGAVPGIVSLLFMPMFVVAQGTLTVESSKSVYGPGESIEFTVTIRNETASRFQLAGSSTCQAAFIFDGVDSANYAVCTTDALLIDYEPGSSRSWTWTLDPNELGLPRADGLHEIIGYYPGTQMADTISVAAPRSLGGIVHVRIHAGVTHDDLHEVIDSLDAEVLYSFEHSDGHRSEEWLVSGMNPVDAALWLNSDARFQNAEVVFSIHGATQTDVQDEWTMSRDLDIGPVYPNPCSVACRIQPRKFSSGPVEIALYDMLGRRLAGYERTFAGTSPSIEYDVSGLPNGMYFMLMTEKGRMASTAFLVMR